MSEINPKFEIPLYSRTTNEIQVPNASILMREMILLYDREMTFPIDSSAVNRQRLKIKPFGHYGSKWGGFGLWSWEEGKTPG